MGLKVSVVLKLFRVIIQLDRGVEVMNAFQLASGDVPHAYKEAEGQRKDHENRRESPAVGLEFVIVVEHQIDGSAEAIEQL